MLAVPSVARAVPASVNWLGPVAPPLRSGQYDDLEGAAERVLFDDE